MAIIELNQTWANESAEQDDTGALRLDVGYQAIADEPITSTLSVLADPRLPAWGVIVPGSPPMMVVRRRVTRIEESRLVAEAVVTYSSAFAAPQTDPEKGGGRRPEEDPKKWLPQIEWNPVEGTEVAIVGFLKDKDTNTFSNTISKITNSALRPYFDPPVEKRHYDWQVLYRRNEASVNAELLKYNGVINSDSFTIDGVPIPAEKALMVPPRIGPLQYENGFTYREVTYDIRLTITRGRAGPASTVIAFEGWHVELQDRGYDYFVGEGEDRKLVRAKNDDTTKTTDPVWLDGEGGLASSPEASPPRVYQIYPKLPFSVFNFQ